MALLFELPMPLLSPANFYSKRVNVPAIFSKDGFSVVPFLGIMKPVHGHVTIGQRAFVILGPLCAMQLLP